MGKRVDQMTDLERFDWHLELSEMRRLRLKQNKLMRMLFRTVVLISSVWAAIVRIWFW